MRVAVPITYPEACWSQMEWRLDGTVCTIGELLLQLGGTQDLLHDVIAEAHMSSRLVSKVHACLCARIRFVLRPAMLAHLFITNLFNMCSLDFSF